MFTLVSEYAANLSLVVVGFFEVITIAYVYGMCVILNRRFRSPVRYAITSSQCIFWKLKAFLRSKLRSCKIN